MSGGVAVGDEDGDETGAMECIKIYNFDETKVLRVLF